MSTNDKLHALIAGVEDQLDISLDATHTAVDAAPGGDSGSDGASAYQVAVADGFVGNEAAWLASLDSTVAGPKGDKGDQGDASTVAGPKGDKGDQGDASTVAGPKGDKGDQGDASTVPGPRGNPGPEALQLSLANRTGITPAPVVISDGMGAVAELATVFTIPANGTAAVGSISFHVVAETNSAGFQVLVDENPYGDAPTAEVGSSDPSIALDMADLTPGEHTLTVIVAVDGSGVGTYTLTAGAVVVTCSVPTLVAAVALSGAYTDLVGAPDAGVGLTKLAAQAVSITEAIIAHGLDHIPTVVIPVANDFFWVKESTTADATHVFITASASGTADIYVR